MQLFYRVSKASNAHELKRRWRVFTGCRPYSIAPCEHSVNGTRPPCHREEETPKCEERCVDGYSTSYWKDKHLGTDLQNELPSRSPPLPVAPVVTRRFLVCPPPPPVPVPPSAGRDAYSVPSQEEQIMAELFKRGPVEAAFSVYTDFALYKTGEAGLTLSLE